MKESEVVKSGSDDESERFFCGMRQGFGGVSSRRASVTEDASANSM